MWLTIPVMCAFFSGGCIDAVSVGFANGVESAIAGTIEAVVTDLLTPVLTPDDGGE